MDFLKLPGYSDFTPKIFVYLDLHTLISCKLVCKSWANHINLLYPDLISLKRRLATLDVRQKAIYQYDDQWPPWSPSDDQLDSPILEIVSPFPWSQVFQQFATEITLESLKYFINFLEDYLENRAEFENPIIEAPTVGRINYDPSQPNHNFNIHPFRPIRYAIYNDNIKFLQILLNEAPAKVDDRSIGVDWNLEQPLEFAWDNLKMSSIEFLLKHFAKLKLKLSFTWTFMMEKFIIFELPKEKYAHLVKFLLEYPAQLEVDLTAVDLFGNVFLYWAVRFYRDSPDSLRLILKHFIDNGIDINAKRPDGESILEYAERSDMSNIIRIFNEFGLE